MPRRRLVRSALKALGWSIAHACFSTRVEGQHNIPRSGPLIVICNHFHWSEPLVLGVNLPFQVEFIGSAATLRLPYVGWLLRLYSGIPVERGTFNRDALNVALKVLEKREVVGIFPEGRTHIGHLAEPFPGMAFLAMHSQAPILPAAVEGSDVAEGAWRPFRRHPLVLRFGPVFRPQTPRNNGVHARERLEAVSDDMMRHIAGLLPPHNRGRYV